MGSSRASEVWLFQVILIEITGKHLYKTSCLPHPCWDWPGNEFGCWKLLGRCMKESTISSAHGQNKDDLTNKNPFPLIRIKNRVNQILKTSHPHPPCRDCLGNESACCKVLSGYMHLTSNSTNGGKKEYRKEGNEFPLILIVNRFERNVRTCQCLRVDEMY